MAKKKSYTETRIELRDKMVAANKAFASSKSKSKTTINKLEKAAAKARQNYIDHVTSKPQPAT